MLLTLATRSFAGRLGEPRSGGPGNGMVGDSPAEPGGGTKPEAAVCPATLLDLPEFAIRQLQLRGLNVHATMLAGWSLNDLDQLRDQADKVACPCLVLVEDTPLPLAAPEKESSTLSRVQSLAMAANRLGCNALSLRIEAEDTIENFDALVERIKSIMPLVERYELNVLIEPMEGITYSPDRLTDLIKKIGGFRIGSLPTFAHAASTGEMIETLRKLAPYAGAIHATIDGFTKAGRHRDYDLEKCVNAIRSVGFINTLAIEYSGDDDPVEAIEQARVMLQQAIDAEPE